MTRSARAHMLAHFSNSSFIKFLYLHSQRSSFSINRKSTAGLVFHSTFQGEGKNISANIHQYLLSPWEHQHKTNICELLVLWGATIMFPVRTFLHWKNYVQNLQNYILKYILHTMIVYFRLALTCEILADPGT